MDRNTEPGWHTETDATGLLCPLPVLKARRELARMPPGAVLRLRATDPAVWVDIPHFCAEAGHALIEAIEQNGEKVFLIRRGN